MAKSSCRGGKGCVLCFNLLVLLPPLAGLCALLCLVVGIDHLAEAVIAALITECLLAFTEQAPASLFSLASSIYLCVQETPNDAERAGRFFALLFLINGVAALVYLLRIEAVAMWPRPLAPMHRGIRAGCSMLLTCLDCVTLRLFSSAYQAQSIRSDTETSDTTAACELLKRTNQHNSKLKRCSSGRCWHYYVCCCLSGVTEVLLVPMVLVIFAVDPR